MDGHDIFLADCPARTTLEIISGTWVTVVVYALRDGPLRYSELVRRIGGISNKVLTQTLRRLVRHGIVRRDPGSGGSVCYGLTSLGQSLLGPVAVLAEWAHDHGAAVVAAQDNALTPGTPGYPAGS